MSELIMCDKYVDQPAVVRFQWPWDGPQSQGHASSRYLAELRQMEKNLKRQCIFTEVQKQDQPLNRSERTQLIAAKMAADGEADEVRRRNSELFQTNTELSARIKHEETQNAQAVIQIAELEAQKRSLADAVAKAQSETAVANEELQKAQKLLAAGPGAADAEIANLRAQVASLQEQLAEANGAE